MKFSPIDMIHVHSLDALDPNAYAAFQASHDLQDVVDRVLGRGAGGDGATPSLKKGLSVRASLMTPVKPMLVMFACYTLGRSEVGGCLLPTLSSVQL